MTDDATPIAELKARIMAFVSERDWAQYHSPKNLTMALSCEAAELMEHYLWAETPDASKRADIEAEAADVALCLLNFCNVVGIDLAAALERKLADAAAKYPADRVRGQARKYDEY